MKNEINKDTDVFDSILKVAESIGYEIPETNPDEVLIKNQFLSYQKIRTLLSLNSRKLQLEDNLKSHKENEKVKGLFEQHRVEYMTNRIQNSIEDLKSIEENKPLIFMRLTQEETYPCIPIELDHQKNFKELFKVIAKDKWYIHELMAESKRLFNDDNHAISWQSKIEELSDSIKEIENIKILYREQSKILEDILEQTKQANIKLIDIPDTYKIITEHNNDNNMEE